MINEFKMSNPRKFSEKIALHSQKMAEETAAFEQIMREVGKAVVEPNSFSHHSNSQQQQQQQYHQQHFHLQQQQQQRPQRHRSGGHVVTGNGYDVTATSSTDCRLSEFVTSPSGATGPVTTLDSSRSSGCADARHSLVGPQRSGRTVGKQRRETSPYSSQLLSPPSLHLTGGDALLPAGTSPASSWGSTGGLAGTGREWRRAASDSALNRAGQTDCGALFGGGATRHSLSPADSAAAQQTSLAATDHCSRQHFAPAPAPATSANLSCSVETSSGAYTAQSLAHSSPVNGGAGVFNCDTVPTVVENWSLSANERQQQQQQQQQQEQCYHKSRTTVQCFTPPTHFDGVHSGAVLAHAADHTLNGCGGDYRCDSDARSLATAGACMSGSLPNLAAAASSSPGRPPAVSSTALNSHSTGSSPPLPAAALSPTHHSFQAISNRLNVPQCGYRNQNHQVWPEVAGSRLCSNGVSPAPTQHHTPTDASLSPLSSQHSAQHCSHYSRPLSPHQSFAAQFSCALSLPHSYCSGTLSPQPHSPERTGALHYGPAASPPSPQHAPYSSAVGAARSDHIDTTVSPLDYFYQQQQQQEKQQQQQRHGAGSLATPHSEFHSPFDKRTAVANTEGVFNDLSYCYRQTQLSPCSSPVFDQVGVRCDTPVCDSGGCVSLSTSPAATSAAAAAVDHSSAQQLHEQLQRQFEQFGMDMYRSTDVYCDSSGSPATRPHSSCAPLSTAAIPEIILSDFSCSSSAGAVSGQHCHGLPAPGYCPAGGAASCGLQGDPLKDTDLSELDLDGLISAHTGGELLDPDASNCFELGT